MSQNETVSEAPTVFDVRAMARAVYDAYEDAGDPPEHVPSEMANARFAGLYESWLILLGLKDDATRAILQGDEDATMQILGNALSAALALGNSEAEVYATT